MRTLLTLVSLVLTLSINLAGQDWSKSVHDFYNDHIILLRDEEGFCTAFAVQKNIFLTAAHCVMTETGEVEKHQTAYDQFHATYTTDLMKVDPSVDLAEVGVLIGHKKPVKLAKENPTLGVPSLAIGFAGMQQLPAVTAGHIVGYVEDTPLIASSNPFQGGYSGGPLINQHEEVIGLVDRTSVILGYSIPVSYIHQFLGDLK